MLRFALIGNPNCGKTTLFNILTGSTAHVGNWPGVTVEKKDGKLIGNSVSNNVAGFVLKNDEGKSLRPDVLIKLPDNHSIIVDSKVSLTAFVDYCNAEDEDVRIVAGKKHLQSVYAHIDELYAKMYQNNQ